jgi:2,4-dienoyl-CoA reductase-like NADH-dependent reductase (Old Yellow Enzyme family)
MLLDPLKIRGLELPNRVVLAPMSQRSADETGCASTWHLVHYGSRAVGGVGLVMIEDSAVSPEGRGHSGALGLYTDEQAAALAPIVEFCHDQGAKVGVQLGHAGRKAFTDSPALNRIVGATGQRFNASSHQPHGLTGEEIRELVGAFGRAAARASQIGVDVIEIHASNGYLIHEFLSPLTNHRVGPYGGNPEANSRFLVDIVEAVRAACGPEMPLFVRLTIDDLADGGWHVDDALPVISRLASAGCDAIDAAAGGAVEGASSFEVPVDFRSLAARVRQATGMPTIVAGGISTAEAAEAALADGACDLVAVGRLLLTNPFWVNSLKESAGGR